MAISLLDLPNETLHNIASHLLQPDWYLTPHFRLLLVSKQFSGHLLPFFTKVEKFRHVNPVSLKWWSSWMYEDDEELNLDLLTNYLAVLKIFPEMAQAVSTFELRWADSYNDDGYPITLPCEITISIERIIGQMIHCMNPSVNIVASEEFSRQAYFRRACSALSRKYGKGLDITVHFDNDYGNLPSNMVQHVAPFVGKLALLSEIDHITQDFTAPLLYIPNTFPHLHDFTLCIRAWIVNGELEFLRRLVNAIPTDCKIRLRDIQMNYQEPAETISKIGSLVGHFRNVGLVFDNSGGKFGTKWFKYPSYKLSHLQIEFEEQNFDGHTFEKESTLAFNHWLENFSYYCPCIENLDLNIPALDPYFLLQFLSNPENFAELKTLSYSCPEAAFTNYGWDETSWIVLQTKELTPLPNTQYKFTRKLKAGENGLWDADSYESQLKEILSKRNVKVNEKTKKENWWWAKSGEKHTNFAGE